jgi:hypothetical protein
MLSGMNDLANGKHAGSSGGISAYERNVDHRRWHKNFGL